METNLRNLAARQCKPCEGGTPPLGQEAAERYLATLPGWEMAEGAIRKKFSFDNFNETMAFVNAVAWIAYRQGHHPGMDVSYRRCVVRYTTHAIGGLSENDFISAAKVERLFEE